MSDERPLSRMEATLGLSLIAGLLFALGAAYVHQFDEPPPVTPPDPNWVSAPSAESVPSAVEQISYRPEWLTPHSDPPATTVH